MKNKTKLIIFSLFTFILISGFVSADNSTVPTIISGKAYDGKIGGPTLSGVKIVVLCNGNIKNTSSLSDGTYGVLFEPGLCPAKSNVTASIVNGVVVASAKGVLHEDSFLISGVINIEAKSYSLVVGKVYKDKRGKYPLSNATVTINCNGKIKKTVSLSDGTYGVSYNTALCNFNNKLTGSATSGNITVNGIGSFMRNVPYYGYNLGLMNIFPKK